MRGLRGFAAVFLFAISGPTWGADTPAAVTPATAASLGPAAATGAPVSDQGAPLQDGSWPTVGGVKGKKNKNDTSDLRVIQERPFTFRNKLEFGLLYSGVFTDPFLSVASYNAIVGYHFHDYVAINLLGGIYTNSPSSALTKLRSQSTVDANVNKIKSFYGGEIAFSPFFGKLGLIGKWIVYLDLRLTGGLGQIVTDTGTYLAPNGGVGSSYVLGRHYVLRIDYHLMYYSEMLLQQNPSQSNYGQLFGPRGNTTDIVSIGATYLF